MCLSICLCLRFPLWYNHIQQARYRRYDESHTFIMSPNNVKSCVISFPISATSPPSAFEERRWLLFVRCPGEEKVLFLLHSFFLSRLTIVSKRAEDQAATSFSFSTDGEVTAKSSLASKVPLQSKSLHQTPSSHNLNIEVRPRGLFQLDVSKDLPSL